MESSSASNKRLTLLNGSIWKALWLFCLPIYFAILLQQGYGWVDGYLLGLKDAAGFTALSLTGNLIYFGTTFSSGFPSGAMSYTGKLYGSHDIEGVRRSFATSVWLSLLSGIFISVVMLSLVDPIMVVAQVPSGAVGDEVRLYLYLIFGLGLLGIHLQTLIIFFFRAIDSAKESFWVMGFYSLLNIALDFLFVYALNLGALGVAVAYLLSQYLSALFGFALLAIRHRELLPKSGDWSLKKSEVWAHLRIALPNALQSAVIGVGLFLLQRSLNSFGSAAINGYGIANRFYNFLVLLNAAISSGLLFFVGQNFGAKQYQRVKKGTLEAFLILLVYSIVCAALFLLLRDKMCSLFVHDNEALKQTAPFCDQVVYIFVWSFIFNASLNLFRNILFGLQRPLMSFLSTIGESTVRIVFATALTPFLGFAAIPFGDLASWITSTIISGIGVLVAFRSFPKVETMGKNNGK